MLFVFELGVALPDHPAIAVCAVPDLRTVPAAAAPALDLRGENGGTAEAQVGSARGDDVLHPVEHRRLDNGGMAVFHVVLRNCAVVLHPFFREVIGCVALLEQSAALVLFIRQNRLDRTAAPDIVAGGRFDSQSRTLFAALTT